MAEEYVRSNRSNAASWAARANSSRGTYSRAFAVWLAGLGCFGAFACGGGTVGGSLGDHAAGGDSDRDEPCADASCPDGGDQSGDCDAGWSWAGDVCVDVNECATEPPPCDPNAICENVEGSFSCQCRPGFAGNGLAEPEQGCTEIDECAETSPCQNGGQCIDGLNGYTCDCTGTGYAGVDCEVLLLAPLAYWPFDAELHSRASLDRSGGGNDVYPVSSVTPPTEPQWRADCEGSAGACYAFSGSDAHLEASFHHAGRFTASTDFTLVARIEAAQAIQPAEILHSPRYEACDPLLRAETCPPIRQEKPNRYAFRLYLRDHVLRLCTWLADDASCAAVAYPENLLEQWVQVIAWKRGDSLCLSLDGNTPSCSVATVSNPVPPPAGQLFVGAHPSGVNPYSGRLDEVMIFDRALSESEREQLASGNTAVDTCDPGDADCCGNDLCDAGEDVGTCIADCSDGFWEEAFLRDYFSKKTYNTVSRHNPGYAYWANLRIRPFMDMYEATGKSFYFSTAVENTKRAIRLQNDTNGDGVWEWPCYEDSYGCAAFGAKNGLSAERAARAITGLARLIISRPELGDYASWAQAIAHNIRVTLIQNPLYASRYNDTGYVSPDTYPIGFPVHHIVAHATTVMFNLNQVLENGASSGTFYDRYRIRARHLRDSLLPNPGGAGVAWGSIHCGALTQEPICYTGWDVVLSVLCKDPTNSAATYCYPMDSAHSTDFVDTAVQLADAGPTVGVFDAADIAQLAATFESVMLQQDSSGSYYFSTHIDGNDHPEVTPDRQACAEILRSWDPGDPVPECAQKATVPRFWTRGHLAPGWTALARDNLPLLQILASMADNPEPYEIPWQQRLRFYAQMTLLDAPEL